MGDPSVPPNTSPTPTASGEPGPALSTAPGGFIEVPAPLPYPSPPSGRTERGGGRAGTGASDQGNTPNESCVRDLGCQSTLRIPGKGVSVVTSCGRGECPNCPNGNPMSGIIVSAWCVYSEFPDYGACSIVKTRIGGLILGPYCFSRDPQSDSNTGRRPISRPIDPNPEPKPHN